MGTGERRGGGPDNRTVDAWRKGIRELGKLYKQGATALNRDFISTLDRLGFSDDLTKDPAFQRVLQQELQGDADMVSRDIPARRARLSPEKPKPTPPVEDLPSPEELGLPTAGRAPIMEVPQRPVDVAWEREKADRRADGAMTFARSREAEIERWRARRETVRHEIERLSPHHSPGERKYALSPTEVQAERLREEKVRALRDELEDLDDKLSRK